VGDDIADCRFLIADSVSDSVNRQLAIDNRQCIRTHPLPRGGTDLMPLRYIQPAVALQKTSVAARLLALEVCYRE